MKSYCPICEFERTKLPPGTACPECGDTGPPLEEIELRPDGRPRKINRGVMELVYACVFLTVACALTIWFLTRPRSNPAAPMTESDSVQTSQTKGGKSPLTELKVVPLSPTEKEWLETQRISARTLVEHFTGETCDGRPSLEQIDLAFDLWHAAQSPPTEPGVEVPDVVNRDDATSAFAIAMGDCIQAETGLEWVVITDVFGTEISLFLELEEGEYSEIVVSPISMMANRVDQGITGWVGSTTEATVETVRSKIVQD